MIKFVGFVAHKICHHWDKACDFQKTDTEIFAEFYVKYPPMLDAISDSVLKARLDGLTAPNKFTLLKVLTVLGPALQAVEPKPGQPSTDGDDDE